MLRYGIPHWNGIVCISYECREPGLKRWGEDLASAAVFGYTKTSQSALPRHHVVQKNRQIREADVVSDPNDVVGPIKNCYHQGSQTDSKLSKPRQVHSDASEYRRCNMGGYETTQGG